MLKFLIITGFLGLPVLGLRDSKSGDFCLPFDPLQTCCFTPAEFGWVGGWFEQQVLHGIIENLNLDPILIEADEQTEEHGAYTVAWEAFEFFGLDNLMIDSTATLLCTRGWDMSVDAELTLGTENGGASDGFMADVPLAVYVAGIPVGWIVLPYPTSVVIPDIRIAFSVSVKINPLDCGGDRMKIEDLYVADIHGARVEGWPDLTGSWLEGAQDQIAFWMTKLVEGEMKNKAQSTVDGNNFICDMCGHGIPLPWC